MPGGPKLTPSNPKKRKVMDKWVNQGAMIMRSVIIIVILIIMANMNIIVRFWKKIDLLNQAI